MGSDQRGRAIPFSGVGLTNEDIYEAMRAIPGYIDITPGDFKELYCIAYKQAMDRFARSILAKDMMEDQVLYVLPDAPLMKIAEILSDKGVSGLPVIDADRKVIGIVSEKDILRRIGFTDSANSMTIVTRCLQSGGQISVPAQSLTAGEIMSSPAITVEAGTPLLEIVRLLAEKSINRLPVTDSQGHLIGILARTDIVNAALRSGTCSWNTSER